MLALTSLTLLQMSLYGLALAVADQAAIAVGNKTGRKAGLATWLALVLIPLLMLLILQPVTGLGAGCVATLLSGLAYLHSRQEATNRLMDSGFDCELDEPQPTGDQPLAVLTPWFDEPVTSLDVIKKETS